jgi:hypothetical protein
LTLLQSRSKDRSLVALGSSYSFVYSLNSCENVDEK